MGCSVPLMTEYPASSVLLRSVANVVRHFSKLPLPLYADVLLSDVSFIMTSSGQHCSNQSRDEFDRHEQMVHVRHSDLHRVDRLGRPASVHWDGLHSGYTELHAAQQPPCVRFCSSTGDDSSRPSTKVEGQRRHPPEHYGTSTVPPAFSLTRAAPPVFSRGRQPPTSAVYADNGEKSRHDVTRNSLLKSSLSPRLR